MAGKSCLAMADEDSGTTLISDNYKQCHANGEKTMWMRFNSLVLVLFVATAVWSDESPRKPLPKAPADDISEARPVLTFRKVMSAPAEYDDNFQHAVIAVSNEHKALIARNYIVAGSSERITWLREHPERRGNRLFSLGSEKPKLTRLWDSTCFGFVPNSTMAWLLICDGTVRFWDTRNHQQLEAVFPHSLASECAGPSPAISPDGRIMATQTDESLQLWDLRTLEPMLPELEHDWVRDMEFSSDGKWLFTRGRRKLKIRAAKTGKPLAGPFRQDLIAQGFAYSPKPQQLVTFENNDEEEADWKSVAVIRSGKDWSTLSIMRERIFNTIAIAAAAPAGRPVSAARGAQRCGTDHCGEPALC